MSKHLIQSSFLFSQLSDAELEAIQSLGVEESYGLGEKIIESDRPNDSIWILLEGYAVVRDSLAQGLEIDLCKLRPGEVFGEMSFVDSSANASATVMASGPSKVLRWKFESLQEFFTDYPNAEVKVLRTLGKTFSQRLRRANREIKKGFMASLGLAGE